MLRLLVDGVVLLVAENTTWFIVHGVAVPPSLTLFAVLLDEAFCPNQFPIVSIDKDPDVGKDLAIILIDHN